MPINMYVLLNGFSAAAEEYNLHDMDDRSWATGTTSSSLSEGLATMNRLTKISEELAVQNSSLTEANKKLSEENEELKAKVSRLEARLNQQQAAHNPAHIDAEVSKAVKNLYKTFVAEEKFKTEERFTSPHNLYVKNRLFETIRSTGSFTEAADNTIHLAIRGRFTTGKKTNSKTTPVKKANRIRARRYSSYICRRRISLSTGLHKDIMQTAKPADMSELISDEETGSLIVRQPEGRTDEFIKLWLTWMPILQNPGPGCNLLALETTRPDE